MVGKLIGKSFRKIAGKLFRNLIEKPVENVSIQL